MYSLFPTGRLLAAVGLVTRRRFFTVMGFGAYAAAVSAVYLSIERRGAETHTCPVCGQQSVFTAYGDPIRRHARCRKCGSLERHRLLYLYLRDKTPLFRDRLSVLHFSPEPGLRSVLEARSNLRYATSWYEQDRHADYHLDLTRLDLHDASWDVLIAYHVFEHIPQDRQGMREMFRVLKPGGWAVLQVPVREEPDSYENPSIASPEDRDKHFGQHDHVRYYGWKDFADRLHEAGFDVTIDRYGSELPVELVSAYALDRNERIYLARKPSATGRDI